ncbi:MAG: flagellar hook-length control protein FliK [Candidatus Sulfotelmatobacter sp.]
MPKETYPHITDPSKSEAKKSDSKSAGSKPTDSKTNSLQDRSNPSTQSVASNTEPQDEAALAAAVPMLPLPIPAALPIVLWNADPNDLTTDTHFAREVNNSGPSSATSGVEAAAKTNASSGPTSLPMPSRNAIAVAPVADPKKQDSLNAAASLDSKSAIGSIKNLPATPASDSKTQSDTPPAPAHSILRGATETTEAASKVPASIKSEIEPRLMPQGVVAPTLVASVPGQPETGSLQEMAPKTVLDKPGLSATQDSVGTTRGTSDVTGTAKPQSRKDDSQLSPGSQSADQSAVAAPAKAIDASQVFSVAGTQVAAAGDSKIATAGVARETDNQQTGQLEQNSTGVAQSPLPGETSSAYPTSLVHSAKLVERIGEAELRLGIRAGEFGSVDIRTSMARNQFTAEISVERGELGRVMAAELPSLQNRLSEQRVPVANITVQNHTGGDSTASGQQKPRDGQPAYATYPVSGREEGPMLALVASEPTASTSGLDIHM